MTADGRDQRPRALREGPRHRPLQGRSPSPRHGRAPSRQARQTARAAGLPGLRHAAELAASPALAPLRDPALFASVHTIDLDTAIAWADDLDMCGDHLWRLAHEQTGSLMPRDAFRAWRARHGLSLAAAAEALGVPRRMVAGYDSGERPIPKTVRLACLGWEAARRPEQAA